MDIPRDSAGSFIPTMVPQGSRRLTDVVEMIVNLYTGGMINRSVYHHMATAMRVDIGESAYIYLYVR
ncbi:transposase [Corynebacterium propinquum]|uniref:Transposase n=1 Tax=Corynebacterium propinquum TaxID=43769 RepID=A0ABT7G3N1_9CORY|nr:MULTISPECIES: transposase [Corynebacterium]MDK4301342.1 transposase [Corynebacterium propinquum]MDK4329151.1 transposase [Corynebacterium pseudodiphtheriticum]WKS30947.1 transposase [Corynebacterium pseudodiphtheriticum]WKS52407.1 transposase [Corynebacterium pseudodiphtheriticum]